MTRINGRAEDGPIGTAAWRSGQRLCELAKARRWSPASFTGKVPRNDWYNRTVISTRSSILRLTCERWSSGVPCCLQEPTSGTTLQTVSVYTYVYTCVQPFSTAAANEATDRNVTEKTTDRNVTEKTTDRNVTEKTTNRNVVEETTDRRRVPNAPRSRETFKRSARGWRSVGAKWRVANLSHTSGTRGAGAKTLYKKTGPQD
jgi:hypothetical protein